MTHTEALKLALEALEEAWYHVGTFQPTEKAIDLYDEARTAIKEALAQPEYRAVKTYHEGKPVYVAQPEQEPVAWRTFDGKGGYEYRAYEMNEQYAQEWEQRNPKHKDWVEPLYTSPPQRPWVGLTDEEAVECWPGLAMYADCAKFWENIEAKLKEKNNG